LYSERVVMAKEKKLRLAKLWFRYSSNIAHSTRIFMIDELEWLFIAIDDMPALNQTYLDLIISDDCLRKQFGISRVHFARHRENRVAFI